MQYQLQYHEAHQQIISMLGDMSSYFKWLRENNPDGYEKKAHWLVIIRDYIKASKYAYIALEQEADEAYRRGIEQGKYIAEKQDFEQQVHEWLRSYQPIQRAGMYSISNSFKEGIRAKSIEQLEQEMPHLF